jgi:uncharacterized RDD family membrane protein YckC
MSYVGVGKRFLAILVDSVVALVWTIPLAERVPVGQDAGALAFTLQVNSDRWEIAGVRLLAYCLLWFIYFLVMEATLGATVGKLVTGIRVVRPDGSPIGWRESFIRNTVRIVDGIPFVIPYLLGAIVIWSGGPEKRRVGDRLGERRVVTKASIGATRTLPPSVPPIAPTGAPPAPQPGASPPMPPPPPAP